MASDEVLVLLAPLKGTPLGHGRIGLTRKFIDGVHEYVEHWNGPLRVLVEPSTGPRTDLDQLEVEPERLPFRLELMDFTSKEMAKRLASASVVLGAVSHRQNHIARLCRTLGVASVYMTEHTLRTHLDAIAAGTSNPLLRARRAAWSIRQELRKRRAITEASGLQCNGTPAYEAYRHLNARPFLYFDNRIRSEMILDREGLDRRLLGLADSRPLKLAFTGRLEREKGAHHLPAFARALRARGVDFRLDICGDGSLTTELEREIDRLGLGGKVFLRGILDFRDELVPLLQKEVDLFVCPHVQGDPSCTYMETLACGVPIVGFENTALAGLVRLAPIGFTTPMGNVDALAERVRRLDQKRARIAAASRAALALAHEHTFESTFRSRVEHLRSCIERPSAFVHRLTPRSSPGFAAS